MEIKVKKYHTFYITNVNLANIYISPLSNSTPFGVPYWYCETTSQYDTCFVPQFQYDKMNCCTSIGKHKISNSYLVKKKINQRTIGPVNAHLISGSRFH